MTHNIISDIYNFKTRLGKGSFGEVYLVYSKIHKIDIACKIEEIKTRSRLKHEYKIYSILARKNVKCIPNVYTLSEADGTTAKFYLMGIELMGFSLDTIFNNNNKKMDIGTVLNVAIQCISAIKLVHNAGIIHRDIKPSNFVVDVDGKNKIYVIDFGLSRRYLTSDKKHIDLTTGRSLLGTARYVSLNIHLGFEPSRRDDLESIGFMLLYFLRGSLPWQGLKKRNSKNKDAIGEKKLCTTIEDLCKEYPECFSNYMKYCRNLQFEEKPNYDYLIQLFNEYAKSNNIELNFYK